jgi:deazaflavin-dependent oxidoreductase (nitroreductase family)
MTPQLGDVESGGAMAKTYRFSVAARMINFVFRLMTRLGVGAPYRHILTVPGRKTGRLYSTPVDVIEVAGDRWLVAGYGPVSWVRNARAAGEVTLSRGGRSEKFRVVEAASEAAIPVLRAYVDEIKVTRPYFDAGPDSPDDAIAAELRRHAVFRLAPEVAQTKKR